MAMPGKCFRGREAMILQEKQLIMSYLMNKIGALAHPTCNGQAGAEAWPFARIVFPVSCTKFDIFRHCSKLGKCLDCISGIALLDILETKLYDFHNVIASGIVLLRCE